jgi:hypothetical protein
MVMTSITRGVKILNGYFSEYWFDCVTRYTVITERSAVAASSHASCRGGDEASNAITTYRLLSL